MYGKKRLTSCSPAAIPYETANVTQPTASTVIGSHANPACGEQIHMVPLPIHTSERTSARIGAQGAVSGQLPGGCTQSASPTTSLQLCAGLVVWGGRPARGGSQPPRECSTAGEAGSPKPQNQAAPEAAPEAGSPRGRGAHREIPSETPPHASVGQALGVVAGAPGSLDRIDGCQNQRSTALHSGSSAMVAVNSRKGWQDTLV